jgi:hypothetical protein
MGEDRNTDRPASLDIPICYREAVMQRKLIEVGTEYARSVSAQYLYNLTRVRVVDLGPFGESKGYRRYDGEMVPAGREVIDGDTVVGFARGAKGGLVAVRQVPNPRCPRENVRPGVLMVPPREIQMTWVDYLMREHDRKSEEDAAAARKAARLARRTELETRARALDVRARFNYDTAEVVVSHDVFATLLDVLENSRAV